MSQDISGFGVVVSLIASNTFPVGITLTQFADDGDPIDMPSIQIADKAMGLNGDLITWSKANPLPVTINVIPGSEDDILLSILAQNNRVGRGKNGSRDSITLTILYPDGTGTFLSAGSITDSMFGKSIASSGRQKTKPYAFTFENVITS